MYEKYDRYYTGDPEIRERRSTWWVKTIPFVILLAIILSTPPPISAEPIRTYPIGRIERVPVEDSWENRAPDITESQELKTQIARDTAAEQERLASTYTEDDLFCLAVGICQEAGGDAQSDYTRELVGLVIMNRVASPEFPNSIREVLTARGQYGRLHWTGVKFPSYANQAMIDRAYLLAAKILEEDDLPYCPSNVIWQACFKQGDGVFAKSDGIYFCYSD